MLEAVRPHQLSGEDILTPCSGWIRAASQGMGVRGNYPHTLVSPLRGDGSPPFREVSQEPTGLGEERITGKSEVAMLSLNSLGQA